MECFWNSLTYDIDCHLTGESNFLTRKATAKNTMKMKAFQQELLKSRGACFLVLTQPIPGCATLSELLYSSEPQK